MESCGGEGGGDDWLDLPGGGGGCGDPGLDGPEVLLPHLRLRPADRGGRVGSTRCPGCPGSVAGSCETYERRAVSFQQLFQWDRNRCSAVANGCSDLLLGFGPADFDGIDALLWAAGSQLSRMSTALGSASAVAGLELLSGRRELGPRLLGVGGGVRSVLEK